MLLELLQVELKRVFFHLKRTRANEFLYYCRYTWSKEKFFVAQVQEGMRRHALYEGTDKEREMRESFLKESDIKTV